MAFIIILLLLTVAVNSAKSREMDRDLEEFLEERSKFDKDQNSDTLE